MPVTVDRFLKYCADPLRLRLASGAHGLSREITEREVQEPLPAITGEAESAHPGRIRILGDTELADFRNRSPVLRSRMADLLFSRPMPCAIAGATLPLPPEMLESADRRGVPLFVSNLAAADLLREVTRVLERMFRETATIHAVLMDILDVGVAILGKSGIGKSECALDLILRGHRLVSDDVVHLEKRGPDAVLGTGDDMTRHHMEIRGLGIIDIRELFGPGATVDRKKVEVVIQIEEWDAAKEYDRLGMDERCTELLGVSLPSYLIPVSPGRNLATIVEVAVRNHLLMRRGVFSAAELVERQAKRMEEGRQE